MSSIVVFLAWFGGAGYLLTHCFKIGVLLVFVVASAAGIAGGAVVLWFLAKMLVAHDYTMNPADYDLGGVLARVSSPIREGGTGEILYSKGGRRWSAGARSEDGSPVAKGEEVVVVRYEKGIAYVCRWKDFPGGG
jgi:membrane-bound ClpP family serine protease